MPGYSPKYPLTFSPVDGYFEMNKTILEAIRQNMKNLVLTNPGERIMNPDYGVGIQRFLFENLKSDVDSSLTAEIQYQTKKYLPQVSVIDVSVLTAESSLEVSENGLYVKISYFIPSFGITDQITIGPISG